MDHAKESQSKKDTKIVLHKGMSIVQPMITERATKSR
jgi:hypothetical protein